MAANNSKALQAYIKGLTDLGLCAKRRSTDEEKAQFIEMRKNKQPLPVNVTQYYDENNEEYYIVSETDGGLTHEQRVEYLLMKQRQELSTIKKMLVFFTVLTIIGLTVGFIFGFQ